jgi:hypothetical protein
MAVTKKLSQFGEKIRTPKFRVSYPHIFKPTFDTLKEAWEYSITALFPPGTDFSAMENAANTLKKIALGK